MTFHLTQQNGITYFVKCCGVSLGSLHDRKTINLIKILSYKNPNTFQPDRGTKVSVFLFCFQSLVLFLSSRNHFEGNCQCRNAFLISLCTSEHEQQMESDLIPFLFTAKNFRGCSYFNFLCLNQGLIQNLELQDIPMF